MLAAERRELADLAEGWTRDQWHTPSLCDGWRVQDVVAHVTMTAELPPSRYLLLAVRHGMRLDHMLDQVARKAGRATPEDILRRLRSATDSRRHPPGRAGRHVLSDALVHGLDIRRPLRIGRTIPADRLRIALDTMSGLDAMPVARPRIAGLRLEASDLDWTIGDGQLVRGPADSLLLAIAGRAAGCEELQGPGLATLRNRMGLGTDLKARVKAAKLMQGSPG
jgi:uncharacterized protein (TIGR03083 family)